MGKKEKEYVYVSCSLWEWGFTCLQEIEVLFADECGPDIVHAMAGDFRGWVSPMGMEIV